jgi:kumamolisin
MGREHADDRIIRGPFASLLEASTDLGPAREDRIEITASLTAEAEPAAFIDWARDRALDVQWRPGDDWVIVEGSPPPPSSRPSTYPCMNTAAGAVSTFYASPQQPRCPNTSGTRWPRWPDPQHTHRITCRRRAADHLRLDVPDQGLSPQALLNTYNADDLARDGFTGRGVTIVIFALRRIPAIRPGQVSAPPRVAQFTPGDRRLDARRDARGAVDGIFK